MICGNTENVAFRTIFKRLNSLEDVLDFCNTLHAWAPTPKTWLSNQMPVLCATAIFVILQWLILIWAVSPVPGYLFQILASYIEVIMKPWPGGFPQHA